jgi:hypothetical protein
MESHRDAIRCGMRGRNGEHSLDLVAGCAAVGCR